MYLVFVLLAAVILVAACHRLVVRARYLGVAGLLGLTIAAGLLVRGGALVARNGLTDGLHVPGLARACAGVLIALALLSLALLRRETIASAR